MGVPADYRMDVGTDVVDTAVHLCEKLLEEYPMSTVFAGKVIFRRERFFIKCYIMKRLFPSSDGFYGKALPWWFCPFG
jgi:hypothetical protein